jgi:hypothetical protein
MVSKEAMASLARYLKESFIWLPCGFLGTRGAAARQESLIQQYYPAEVMELTGFVATLQSVVFTHLIEQWMSFAQGMNSCSFTYLL